MLSRRLALAGSLAALALPTLARAAVSPGAPRQITSREIKAEDFGAKGDGVTMNTAMLQAAIDETARRNGVLTLKPGVYLTGSLFLKSGMALRLDKGVRIVGSEALSDYAQMPTRIAGIEMTWPAAVLNIYRQSDVHVFGEGVLDGNGKVWWDRYTKLRADYTPKGLRWASDYDAQRPRLMQVFESERVEIGGGLTFTRSGFWILQIVYSNNVKVSGVIIRNNVDGRGPSTDGIDIDSSRVVLVENADIDVNDDALCLKAGRDSDGLRVNRPTEQILIRNSIIRAGAAGFTVGSETSGGVRDVEVYGLKIMARVGQGVLFKSAHTRGGVVENIHIHDLDVEGVRTAIAVDLNWNPAYSYATIPAGMTGYPAYWEALATPVPRKKGLPRLRNITITDLKARGVRQAFAMSAYPDAPVENFTFARLDIEAQRAGSIRNVRSLRVTDSRVVAADGSKVILEDATGVVGLP